MRRPGRSRPVPDADPAYAGLKARIIARTGHAYYADKDDLLAATLEHIAARLAPQGALSHG